MYKDVENIAHFAIYTVATFFQNICKGYGKGYERVKQIIKDPQNCGGVCDAPKV